MRFMPTVALCAWQDLGMWSLVRGLLFLLLVACLALVACGASTDSGVEVSSDAEPSLVDSFEEEFEDPPNTATPSTAPLETGQVGERFCGSDALCASEFVLDGVSYALSCEAVREDAVLAEVLGSGRAFSHEVVVHAVKGFDRDEVVAISVPGGHCSETDPDEIHTSWSMAFASRASSVIAGRAACQIGALSPQRAEANGCPDAAEITDVTPDGDDQQAQAWPSTEVGEAVSCVYRYPDDLTDQPIAFDGTVLSVSRAEYIDEAAAAPVDLVIQVNEVFRGDLDEIVTMHTFDFSTPDQPGDWDPTGVRILAASSTSLDVMACGFTRPYTVEDAHLWSAMFAD